MPRRLLPSLVAAAAVLAVVPAAQAEVRQLSSRVGPIEVTPYEVRQNGVTIDVPKPDVEGPRGFSSPHHTDGATFRKRLTVPGTYRLSCSLHPVAVTERIVVRR